MLTVKCFIQAFIRTFSIAGKSTQTAEKLWTIERCEDQQRRR